MSEAAQPSCRVLFVDDEESVRYFARRGLKRRGFEVEEADSGLGGLKVLGQESFDVVVTDLRMPGMDGFEFLQRVRARFPSLPIVVITAHGSVENAVQAMRQGAQDFLAKPFEIDELALLVRQVHESDGSTARLDLDVIVGVSAEAERLRDLVAQVAAEDRPVVFEGESGSGRSLCARILHDRSARAGAPHLRFELGGQAKEHLEDGLQRSAARAGRGSLYLSGLDDLDDEAAGIVCRWLDQCGESRPFRLLGGLEGSAAELPPELSGRFEVRIPVPALRTRRDDVPDLAMRFLREAATDLGAVCRDFSPACVDQLMQRSWPGNLRELRNSVQRAVVLHREVEVLEPSHFGGIEPQGVGSEEATYHEALHTFEMDFFSGLFRATRGNVSETARRAGLSRGHLHRKIKQLGLDPDRFR